MRIALWSTGYCRGFGGSEQMVNALLRRFHGAGLETFVIADGNPGRNSTNSHFPPLPHDVEVYVDTFPNPLLSGGKPAAAAADLFRYVKAAFRLWKLFRRRSPEIVHLHLVTLDVFLLILYKRLFDYRLVVTFRGGDITSVDRSRLARVKVRAALRWADAVTAVSEDITERLRHTARGKRTLCIPNGIDQDEVARAVQSVGPVIPEGHFVYGGRLHRDKRVLLLAEVFGHCIRCGIQQNLYMIGDGEERESVVNYISRNGFDKQILLAGAMDRYAALSAFAGARCLLLMSAEEGCPNVVLEAMALGLPVIASAVGGVPELVSHGETGYLFPPDSPELAVQYILHLARDGDAAREMGKRGAEAAGRKFDLAETTLSYIAVYRSLLGAGSRSSPMEKLSRV